MNNHIQNYTKYFNATSYRHLLNLQILKFLFALFFFTISIYVMFFTNSINIIFFCIFPVIIYAFLKNRKKIEKFTSNSKEVAYKDLTVKNQGAIQGNLHVNLEKLQSTNINTRISGIHALESVVQDSPQFYWQTMEAIANYVKQNSHTPNIKDNKENLRITKDIQVALNFIGKKSSSENENNRINLINCDSCSRNFINTDLSTTKLTAGSFWRANLSHTNLIGAQLVGSNFSNTDFRGADLSNIQFEGADLSTALLQDANLSNALLENVNLIGAQLEGTNLTNALIEGADLICAKLIGAKLIGANLSGADLTSANLKAGATWGC